MAGRIPPQNGRRVSVETVALWAPVPRRLSHHQKGESRPAARSLYGYGTYSGGGGRFRTSHLVHRNRRRRSRDCPQEDAGQDPRRVWFGSEARSIEAFTPDLHHSRLFPHGDCCPSSVHDVSERLSIMSPVQTGGSAAKQ